MPVPQPQAVTVHFSCQACGNSFPATKEQMMVQPICPKCRTWGRIVGPDGRPVQAARKGAGSSPYAAAMGASHSEEPVTVDFTVAHGKKDTTAMLRMVFVVVAGLAVLILGYMLISNLQSGAAERKKQERETVLDVKAYETAVDEAMKRVRSALSAGGKNEVIEASDLTQALEAISAQPTGGMKLPWSTPPKPGSPHRSYSFIVKHTDAKGVQHVGFIVLLYYKKSEEVLSAEQALKDQLSNKTHFGLSVQSAMWFLGYQGVNYGGPVRDAMNVAMAAAPPSDFAQFRKRTGIAGDD